MDEVEHSRNRLPRGDRNECRSALRRQRALHTTRRARQRSTYLRTTIVCNLSD